MEPLLRGHPDERSPPLQRPLDNVNLNINVLIFTPDKRSPLLKGHFSDAKMVASQTVTYNFDLWFFSPLCFRLCKTIKKIAIKGWIITINREFLTSSKRPIPFVQDPGCLTHRTDVWMQLVVRPINPQKPAMWCHSACHHQGVQMMAVNSAAVADFCDYFHNHPILILNENLKEILSHSFLSVLIMAKRPIWTYS